MTRTIYLAGIAWALLLCALVHPVFSASADTASMDAGDARLTRLAQKLAASGWDSLTPIAGTAGSKPAPPSRGTPLLRRNSASGAAATAADADRDPVDYSSGLLKTVTALGVVIGLMLLARFGYARLGGKVAAASSPVVEVLSRTVVAPRSHVMLLRVGGRVLVVSDSSAGMRTLASIDDALEVADLLGAVNAAKPTGISRSFAQMFRRFDEDYEGPQAEPQGDVGHRRGGVGTRETLSGLLSRVRGLGREGGAK